MKQTILPPLSDPDDDGPDPMIDPDDLPPGLAFTAVEQRTKRWSGITAQKQRLFIAHLAATGAVTMAAKAAGHSASAFYQLRRREGAYSFGAAWDRAVEMGARRVADLLMEYAIYGVPETWSKEGRVTMERRRPHIRAMQHIARNNFPESFGDAINIDGMPATALPHGIRRLKARWQAEWEKERRDRAAADRLEYDKLQQRQETGLDDRLRSIRTAFQRKIAHDPVKRAAWDLLTGPGTDWQAVIRADAYINPQKHEWHMHHPDMIVPIGAGAADSDWQEETGGDDELPNVEWRPPADDPDGSKGQSDEIWFNRYADHIVEDGDAIGDAIGDGRDDGNGGEKDKARKDGKFTRSEMRTAAATLRARAEAWQQSRQPVIQHPPDFLANPHHQGGPTTPERDAARRRIDREIEALEREWNAAYSEESWAAWKAGDGKAATPDAGTADGT
ncbi:hypothetical protein [Sphingopyxis sp. R3-92]|uniref:hypothetical protein n=1 Tax=Sphingopyxis sp. R3-92 TaxID=3158553 RepID=UPI003EE477D4